MKVDDFWSHKRDMLIQAGPRIDAGPRIQAGGLTHLY